MRTICVPLLAGLWAACVACSGQPTADEAPPAAPQGRCERRCYQSYEHCVGGRQLRVCAERRADACRADCAAQRPPEAGCEGECAERLERGGYGPACRTVCAQARNRCLAVCRQ